MIIFMQERAHDSKYPSEIYTSRSYVVFSHLFTSSSIYAAIPIGEDD